MSIHYALSVILPSLAAHIMIESCSGFCGKDEFGREQACAARASDGKIAAELYLARLSYRGSQRLRGLHRRL